MIRSLTSLRFVFAFMVFCAHCPFYTNRDSFGYQLSSQVLSEGFIGVSFFFILSGFILSLNYAESFEERTISKRHFWIMRVARIYPLYLLTLLAEIPFTMHEYYRSATIWGAKLLTCGAMMQSWVPDIDWTAAFNTPSWSISVEAFFYALFPLLVMRIRNVRSGSLCTIAAFLMLAAGMLIVPPSLHKVIFYNNPLGRLGEFILGIALYRFYASRQLKLWHYNHGTLMEVAAITVFSAFFALHLFVPHVLRFSVYYWLPMVFLLYVFARESGAVSRAISGRVPVFLGEVSFAFYMIHYRVGGLLKSANRQLYIRQDSLFYFLLYFSLTLIASAGIYVFFEKPANRFLRQKFLSSRRSAMAVRQSTRA